MTSGVATARTPSGEWPRQGARVAFGRSEEPRDRGGGGGEQRIGGEWIRVTDPKTYPVLYIGA